MRPYLLVALALGSSASAAESEPSPPAPDAGRRRADAGELPDCPRAECPPRQMGMPNWECADGRRGGPACKQGLDGRCGWTVVECPAAESRPPPPPTSTNVPGKGWIPVGPIQKTAGPALAEKPKGCGKLPDVATLLRWPVQSYGGCSGGIPNPRAPKPRPPQVLQVLPDGSKIIDAGARGCIRVVERGCTTKCLPPDTLIATPLGDVRLDALEPGMPVWTRDREGARVAAVVLRTHVEPVPVTHRMVRLRLSDGRTVLATPGHPGVDGAGIERLRVGEGYDGVRVAEATLVAWPHGTTRDLLPSGETGVYWAEGVPLGSTLR